MPEFLKHLPETFYLWFLSWDWRSVSNIGRLTLPAPGWHSSRAWLWFPQGHSVLSPLWLDQPDSPNLGNCELTDTSLLTLRAKSSTFPSPVWFLKSLMEGTSSGSGSLVIQMSNITKKKTWYTNCVHSCGLKYSRVKNRFYKKNKELYKISKSHSSTGSDSSSESFQVSLNQPLIRPSHKIGS